MHEHSSHHGEGLTQLRSSGSAVGGRRVYLETFGCQMNVLDSQLVRGQLAAMGYQFSEDWKSADVILYNTCSVREHAENKVYSRIGEVGVHKRSRPGVVLGVLGCMAERDGVDLLRRYPQVDLLCGPGELDKVPMLIDNAVKTGLGNRENRGNRGGDGVAARAALQGNTHRRSSTLAAAEDQLELLDLSRSFSPDEHQGSAYVRITRGCNKFCTYCVVPFTRGAEVHRPPDHIVDECKRLADSGVAEVTLLGQTVNHYHYDHGSAVTVGGVQQPQVGAAVGPSGRLHHSVGRRVTTFAGLLSRIHEEVPGLQRLRFVTSFPRDFGDDIFEVMATHRRICRYLHLPVQSASNRILGLMNRGYAIEEYEELLARARAKLGAQTGDLLGRIPGVQIASDIICGFPTETEEDHQATCAFLERARFKNCFIFKYSPRPGTAAMDRFADDVPEETKRRRNNELLAIQGRNSAQVHQEMVGSEVEVFVESVSQRSMKSSSIGGGAAVTLGWEKPVTQLTGRTEGDLIVIFDGDPGLVGSMARVRVESSAVLALFGRLAEAPLGCGER